MSLNLRLGLIFAALLIFGFIAYTVKTKKLNIKYSIVWLLWAVLITFISIFADAFFEFAHFIGIEMPSNAVFLITIGLLYLLTFYVYIMISKHNEEIIKLTYEISVLKKEIEALKKNEK